MKEGNGKGRIARPAARPNGGEETIHHLFPPSPLTPPTPPPTPIKIRHDFSPMPLAPVRSVAARMREGPLLSRAAWRR